MTDPYTDVVAALMTAIRTLSTYFSKAHQVTFNYDRLNIGEEYWLFVTPDAIPSARLDGRDRIYQWQTDCDLYVRYKTTEISIPKYMAVRGALITLLHKPRALKNVNVLKVEVTTNSKLLQSKDANWLIQPFLVRIDQIVSN